MLPSVCFREAENFNFLFWHWRNRRHWKSASVGDTLTISAQNRTIGTILGLKMHIYVILMPNLCKSLPVELFEQFLEHPKSRTISCRHVKTAQIYRSCTLLGHQHRIWIHNSLFCVSQVSYFCNIAAKSCCQNAKVHILGRLWSVHGVLPGSSEADNLHNCALGPQV